MKSRIMAMARSGASGTTACPQSANRSNCTRCCGRAAAISAWHSIGSIGSSSPPSLNHPAQNHCRIRITSHNSGVLPSSMCGAFRLSRRSRRQGKMSRRFLKMASAVAVAAMLALGPQAFAQSEDADAEMRIQRLENQLRQLTGQNEELQFRNRQLEERLRQLGDAQAAPGGATAAVQGGVAAALPPAQANP